MDVITSSAPHINERLDPNGGEYVLTAGDKQLTVSVPDVENPHSITVINTTESPRQPGATTALYARAAELLQTEATWLGMPITYMYGTSSPPMIEWGRNHGAEIFGWQVQNDQNGHFEAHRVFTP